MQGKGNFIGTHSAYLHWHAQLQVVGGKWPQWLRRTPVCSRFMLIYVTRSLSYSVLGRRWRVDLGGNGSSSAGMSGRSSTMFHLRPSRDSASVQHTHTHTHTRARTHAHTRYGCSWQKLVHFYCMMNIRGGSKKISCCTLLDNSPNVKYSIIFERSRTLQLSTLNSICVVLNMLCYTLLWRHVYTS